MKMSLTGIYDKITNHSFRYWIWINAGIWFLFFFINFLSFSFAFNNTNTQSPNFDGIPAAELTEIRTTLFNVYLPYLGLIVGSSIALERNKKYITKKLEGLWPLSIIILSLFFNYYLFKSILDFIADNTAEVQPFLKDMRVFAAALGFFMTGLLSYFFTHGFKRRLNE